MTKENKKNKNKQQQKNRKTKISQIHSLYSQENSYKVFTVINITEAILNIQLKLKYNFILRSTDGCNNTEASYLCRASDLILITVGYGKINEHLISLIKQYMPSAIIVYEKAYKTLAKQISKLFGEIKICESGMLNLLLKDFETKNNMVCVNRPFVVPREVIYEEQYAYVHGFMKSGLRSDKVIINGVHQGIVEEVIFNDIVLSGEQLNEPEDESNFKQEPEASLTEEEAEYELSEEASSMDDEEYIETESYTDNQELSPEYDLIEKYKDYRGIRNLSTCNFKDDKRPEGYENLIFVNRMNHLQNAVKKKPSKIPANTFVKMKIRLSEPINSACFVLFGLYEYEDKPTIFNYEFKSKLSLGQKLVIDNGFRIFEVSPFISKNSADNVFKVEEELSQGVLSFIGPFSFFSQYAYCHSGESVTKIYNGLSYDRIFFECVQLTGKAVKIFKRHCIVKGLFYNKEQVEYFSSVKLEAKNDNFGFIKKSMGTKGLFKAFFAHKLKQNETVTMSLYKRVFLEK